MGPYFGRIIAFSTTANTNRWFWTPINKPWYFPLGNSNDIGSTESEILAVTVHKRMLVFYTQDAIWRLQGDPATRGEQAETNATIGILGPNAVADAGEVDYIAGPDGIYLFDLDQAHKVSKKLDPLFKRESVVIDGDTIAALSADDDARARTVLMYADHLLYVSYAEQGRQYPNITLVLDTESGNWARWKLASGIGSTTGFRSLLFDSNQDALYGALRNGKFYRLNEPGVFEDDGNSFQARYLSRFQDQGHPARDKVYEDLVVRSDTGAQAVTVILHFDGGATEQAVASLVTDGPPGEQIFPLGTDAKGFRARNVAIELDGTTSAKIEVDDIYLHYYIEARQSRGYDSQSLDFETNLVKQVEAVRFEIEQLGEVKCHLESDRPTVALTERQSFSVPGAFDTRKTIDVVLATVVEGVHLRVRLATPNDPIAFRLHGLWLKMRPIGVWLNGAHHAPRRHPRSALEDHRPAERHHAPLRRARLRQALEQQPANRVAVVPPADPRDPAGLRRLHPRDPGYPRRLLRLRARDPADARRVQRLYARHPAHPDHFSDVVLPIRKTPVEGEWVELPLDA